MNLRRGRSNMPMTSFHFAMTAIIVPGLVLGVFTAIEHLTGHPKGQRSWFRFFRGMVVSVLVAQMSAIGFGLYREHPSILFLFFTLLYLSGPLEYMRYHALVHPDRKIPPAVTLPLLPVIPLFLMEVYLYTRPYDRRLEIFGGFFRNPLGHWMIFIFAACLLVTVLYSALLLYTQIALLKESALKRSLLFSAMMTAISLVSTAISCLYFFTVDADYILAGASGISFSFILYFLFKNRFPDFFRLFVREIRLNRYRRTLLEGLDHTAIHARLSELMNEEKLYRDMDLRMKEVAARLLITPHQFSQLLNEGIKTDFRNYINRFRVDEAKRLLVENPSRSIISICFEVGFNSKTSFNITFKKMTGASPKEYREKRCT